MLDLSNVKVAFIDFDDSLCVHLNHRRDSEEWFKAQMKCDLSYYRDREMYAPMIGMKTLLKKLKELDIPVFGLTWAFFNIIEETKYDFVQYYFPENSMKKMIITSSKEGKVQFIKRYCKMEGIKLEEVLFVDDNCQTIELAIDEGINIRTPQEIAVYYGREEILNGEYDKI